MLTRFQRSRPIVSIPITLRTLFSRTRSQTSAIHNSGVERTQTRCANSGFFALSRMASGTVTLLFVESINGSTESVPAVVACVASFRSTGADRAEGARVVIGSERCTGINCVLDRSGQSMHGNTGFKGRGGNLNSTAGTLILIFLILFSPGGRGFLSRFPTGVRLDSFDSFRASACRRRSSRATAAASLSADSSSTASTSMCTLIDRWRIIRRPITSSFSISFLLTYFSLSQRQILALLPNSIQSSKAKLILSAQLKPMLNPAW